MRSDLDRLLQARNLDALVVVGPDGLLDCNAAFRYFVGDAQITGTVVKKRGSRALLLHSDMERDAAAATGLEPVPTTRWPLKEIMEAYSTPLEARIELYRRIFEDLGLGRRVAVAGIDDLNQALALWGGLQSALPSLEVVPEPDGSVLDEARITKDGDEIEKLERVARDTCVIVEELRGLLARTPVRGGALVDDGPLTIGRLRAFATGRMQALGLSLPGGFILSANRDAGVPHSTGDDEHVLREGDVLLFDFYPRGANGYYHDITRTWSIGPARPEVRGAFDDVRDCFEHVMKLVVPGASTRDLQRETCAFFEERGHPTIRQDPGAASGYVHSLGHGLGLEVHELPHFPTFRAGKESRLEPGMVVTIEPGLYDPERGLGVRLEDTVVVTENGARSLSPVSKELELPRARAAERAGG